jgi:uncharacterized protein YdaU (DUF1376 family)
VEKVDAYMPVFVGDYLRDTCHLSLEEHGAYLKLLFVMWGQGHGRLPSDPARLARMVGCDRAEWDRVWPAIAGFFEVDIEGGFITQGRLVHELEAARQRKQKAAENGRKGGEEKARRAKETAPAVSQQGSPGVALRGSSDGPPVALAPSGVATLQATLVAPPVATLVANEVANGWQKPASPSPSESSSPSGSPASASAAQSGARAGDPSATDPAAPAPARPPWRSGYEWLEAFRLAWREVYHRHYGNASDSKAVRDLEDLVLENMPDDEGAELWAQRVPFFGRFLASRDPRVVQGKHAFVLLVTRFSDFRPDLPTLAAPAAGAGSPDRPCDFHAGGANQGKPAVKAYQKPGTCAECRHLQARASPRAAAEPSSMRDLVANVMPGR